MIKFIKMFYDLFKKKEPMIFPTYVRLILQDSNFTEEEITIIEQNWWFYSKTGFRFSDATESEILDECKIVLHCVRANNA